MRKYHLTDKKGHYSGNRRLDVSNCKEPIKDDKEEREKWLKGGRKVRLKRKLKRWKNNISSTTDPENLTVHLVGQSHIDVAWMWREEQTRKKAQVTLRKAILHSDLFPEKFHFAFSQPILLEWIKEDNPTLFKKLQEKVKSGHIELVGGSYVEPDCMMPSTEAMIRQRLYGMRFYKENFGVLPNVEWFLDSFGYNYGLPQILAKSGVDYFWTTKLTWNRDTTFPFINFWWQSPDGTKLLTCNFHYDPQVLEMWEDFEVGRHLLKKDGKKVWNYNDDYSQLRDHVEKDDICPHVGFFFGQSDGGHGPTHQEVVEANKLASLNWFKWSSIEDFFQRINEYSDHFPIWNDELYLEFHRGCFSNHPRVKRYNRKFETLLTSLESLGVLTQYYRPKYQFPQEIIETLWKTTLKNQFHDILPGSSIPEVYDDFWEDWLRQEESVSELKQQIGSSLGASLELSSTPSSTTNLFLYNPLSWKRTGRVFIPIDIFTDSLDLKKGEKPSYATLTLLNDAEKEYICQPVKADQKGSIDPKPAGWWIVLSLDPLSINPAKIKIMDENIFDEITEQKDIEVSKNKISNGKVSVRISPENGAFFSLKSQNVNKGNNLLNGSDSNLLFGFRDRVPIRYHAWNLTPDYWDHPLDYSHNNDLQIRVTEQGPIFSTIEIQKTIGKSPIRERVSLFKNCPEVFLDLFTEWQKKDAMVKVKYSPRTRSTEVTTDGMACAITSKVDPESPCDKARFEKICHKYCDLSTPDNEWGIALLNKGKYAYDVLNDGIRLTLLRACRYPETAPEAWVNQERKLNREKFKHAVPEYIGLGPMSCRYALLPHKGGALRNSDGAPSTFVTQKAEEFNNPIIVIPTQGYLNFQENNLFQEPFLTIRPENVKISAIKLNEWDESDSIIVRFFEFCGEPCEVTVEFNSYISRRISGISSVDLLERQVEEEFKYRNDGILHFPIKKFELRTFNIDLS